MELKFFAKVKTIFGLPCAVKLVRLGCDFIGLESLSNQLQLEVIFEIGYLIKLKIKHPKSYVEADLTVSNTNVFFKLVE